VLQCTECLETSGGTVTIACSSRAAADPWQVLLLLLLVLSLCQNVATTASLGAARPTAECHPHTCSLQPRAPPSCQHQGAPTAERPVRQQGCPCCSLQACCQDVCLQPHAWTLLLLLLKAAAAALLNPAAAAAAAAAAELPQLSLAARQGMAGRCLQHVADGPL